MRVSVLQYQLLANARYRAVGLTPPLKKAFFASPQKGGIFKAWLTASIKNVGELFASLQVIVVGVKLASSMRASAASPKRAASS